MRDKIKNQEYFKKYIARRKQSIDLFQNRLGEGTVKEERIEPVKKEVHRLKYNILIAKYSMGGTY